MTNGKALNTTRVHLHWAYVAEVLELLREKGTGAFTATIEGNFPVVDCAERADAELVVATFQNARLGASMTGPGS